MGQKKLGVVKFTTLGDFFQKHALAKLLDAALSANTEVRPCQEQSKGVGGVPMNLCIHVRGPASEEHLSFGDLLIVKPNTVPN